MAYLIIDPCGRYPEQLMSFLGGKLDKGAIGVFSSPGRWLLWRDKWSKTLGKYLLDGYLVTREPSLRHLAAKIAREWPDLEGVIPWDEQSILLGAQLGDLLELGWNSTQVIERCRDKGVMKAHLREHGRARINAARVVETGEQALDFQRRLGTWPIVVKPTGGSGSEGVFFPESTSELLGACQRVLREGSGEVLLEEYIGGRELAVNGIVDARGDLLVTDVWEYDRRTSHGIPNVYFQTIKLGSHDPLFGILGRYAATIVEDLELQRAPIHMEVKVDDRGPCLIEVGARLAGANLPVLASKIHGRSLFELAACHYVGHLPASMQDLDMKRYDHYEARVVNGVQTHEIRRVRAVHGLAEIEALPSFESVQMVRPVGVRLPVTSDVDTISYEVHLVHSDPARIEADARAVRQLLRYE